MQSISVEAVHIVTYSKISNMFKSHQPYMLHIIQEEHARQVATVGSTCANVQSECINEYTKAWILYTHRLVGMPLLHSMS